MRSPQIRCYSCQGIFTTTQPGQLHHVRCPYCSTINGVPGNGGSSSSGTSNVGSTGNPIAALQIAAASSGNGELSAASLARQEQLLRRLQAREITPLVSATIYCHMPYTECKVLVPTTVCGCVCIFPRNCSYFENSCSIYKTTAPGRLPLRLTNTRCLLLKHA